MRDEVVPLRVQGNQHPFLMTMGASFGAYHAVTFALRYPQLVSRAIGMSGMYDIRRQTDGYSDATIYHYNPADFVHGENDPDRLAQLKRLELVLAIGRDDPMRGENEEFSRRLWAKGLVACVTDLGRLVARLALLAGYDSGVRVRGGLDGRPRASWWPRMSS